MGQAGLKKEKAMKQLFWMFFLFFSSWLSVSGAGAYRGSGQAEAKNRY